MNNAERAEALIKELISSYPTTGKANVSSDPPRFFALQADASNKQSIESTLR